MDRTIQKIGIEDLNIINTLGLRDTIKNTPPNSRMHILARTQKTFSSIYSMLGHKASLSTFERTEIHTKYVL